MTSTPPPPPPYNPRAMQEKAPPAAWLVVVAGLLALAGAFTPWFRPEVTATISGRSVTESVDRSFYSWQDGKIGLIGPIVLVILAIGVVNLILGRSVSRFERGSRGPVASAARGSLIAGAVALVALTVAWFILPNQYSFTFGARTVKWDDVPSFLSSNGATNAEVGHGPQIGFFLTVAAGIVALIAGALMLVTGSKAGSVAPPAPAYGAPQGPAPAYGAPQAPPLGYGAPQQNYGAPQPPPQGYGAPQAPPQGYGPPPQAQ